MADEITLDFIARKLDHVLADVASLSDEVRVQGAILMRVDGTLSALVNEIRATHTQMSRMQNRLAKVEETR